MTAPVPKIADRGRRYVLNTTLGSLCGLAVGAALGLWITDTTGGALRPNQIDTNRKIAIMTATFCTLVGGALGLWLTRFVTTAASNRRRAMLLHILLGALAGVAMSLPVGALILLDPAWGPATLWSKLSLFGVMALVIGGIGAGIGLATGETTAEQEEKEERRAMQAQMVGGPGSLEVARRALERALIEKFGSLDAERREKIQQWDEGRIAEARRRLADAKTLEDLD